MGHYYLLYIYIYKYIYIYINDLPDVVKTFANINLFADDAKLSKHIKAPTESLELQEATTALYAWSEKWLLENDKLLINVKYYH